MGSPLTQTWREWLRLNRDRGCDPTVLFQKALSQGFDADAIALELGAPELLRQAPLLDPHNRPRAWRLDTELAQIYEIPALLTADECTAVISAIDQALVPSTVTRGSADYRTQGLLEVCPSSPGSAISPTVPCAGTAPESWPPSPPTRQLPQAISSASSRRCPIAGCAGASVSRSGGCCWWRSSRS